MDIKINVLIRPRYGDFLYSDVEVEQMCDEIELFRSCGADGVVIGALTEDGDLDMNAMERMIACAGNMNITLHRAFDMTHDPFATLERAIALGVDTVLTSGQAENVQKGMEMLRELKSAAAGRIDIMAGSGVNSGNIKAIFDLTGITTFHASCKKVIEGKMKYKNSDVHMGAAMSEYTLSIADENELGECVRIVKSL